MEEKIQPFRQAERNRVYSNCRGENGRTKFNRNGRSSDSFRLRRLPDPEVSGKRVSHTFAPRKREAGTYSSGNCSGIHTRFPFDPLGRRLAAGFENRCRAKITIFFETRSRFPYFFDRKEAADNRQPPSSPTAGGDPAASPCANSSIHRALRRACRAAHRGHRRLPAAQPVAELGSQLLHLFRDVRQRGCAARPDRSTGRKVPVRRSASGRRVSSPPCARRSGSRCPPDRRASTCGG